MDLVVLREAITKTALEHPQDCECYICKAATGDDDAFMRVVEDLEYLNAEEPDDSNRVLN